MLKAALDDNKRVTMNGSYTRTATFGPSNQFKLTDLIVMYTVYIVQYTQSTK